MAKTTWYNKINKGGNAKTKGGNSGERAFLEGTSDDKRNQKTISGGGL